MKNKISNIIYDLLIVNRSLEVLKDINKSMCSHHTSEAILFLNKTLSDLGLEFVNEETNDLVTYNDIESLALFINSIQSKIINLSEKGDIIRNGKAKNSCLFAYQSSIIAGLWLTADFSSFLPTKIVKDIVKQESIVNPIISIVETPIVEEKEVSPVQEVSPEVVVPPTIDASQSTIDVPTTETVVNPDPANGTLIVDPSITDTTNSPTNTEEVK